MSLKTASFIDIVRLEDKETKLKTFIRTIVEQSGSADTAITLVARSVESPVAKAVAALVREGSITGRVQTVLALVPRHGVQETADETLVSLAQAQGGRVVRDARLFDAHEQLVLGPASSWIGDCMRRDPMKRDAYECYAADCSRTAGWAATSFQRLWQVSEPLKDEMITASAAAVVAEAGLSQANDDATDLGPFRPTRG